MMTLDPARFGGAEHFQREVVNLCEFVRGCPRIESCEEILLPGDPERRMLQKRLRDGIPLDDGELVKLAQRLNVPVPVVQ
jgi:uncharacterized oxidoreductase